MQFGHARILLQIVRISRSRNQFKRGSGCGSAMAAVDLNDADTQKEYIEMLEPDFHGLLQRKEVAILTQARLAFANCKSLSRFNSVAGTRAQLRDFARASLRLDPAVDAMEVAALVDAWEAAKVRMEVRHKAEAEAASSQLPLSLPKVEVQDLRKKFEAAHYALDDKTTPAPSTLELLCDQIENGELKTMYLVQFLSRDDAEIEPVGAMIDKGGQLKIKKGYGETKEPTAPEELRQRLKVVSHAFLMCGMKYPQKTTFEGLEPQDFLAYCDYLLGDQIMGLKAQDEDGNKISAPGLKLVMSYEHQVRKEMVKRVNKGESLKAALEAARKDGIIKERYFLTPAAMNALTAMKSDRSRSPKDGRRARSPNKGRDNWASSSSKGKGKSKGKKGLHTKTPDGREICFKWNSMKERCRYKCGRLHVCQRCFAPDHPVHMCPQSKDTAGGKGGSQDEGAAKRSDGAMSRGQTQPRLRRVQRGQPRRLESCTCSQASPGTPPSVSWPRRRRNGSASASRSRR